MAAQQDESVRSHTFFDSPEGPDASPVRVNRRRRSAAVDGHDDDAETIHTEGYRDAQQAGPPFGETSPIRRNRQRTADQDGNPAGLDAQQDGQVQHGQHGPWRQSFGAFGSGNVHELEFEKSLARSATKMVDIPLS
eukprot:COSAG04_NODE_12084_length_671_cov_1.171329_1_plen_135_part_01